MHIEVTDKAREKLLSYGVGDKKFLRVAVVAGGCSGHTFTASIDNALNEGDETVYEQDGIRVVAEARAALFLDGLQVDYSDDLVTAGFRLTNPKASSTCGCGASFSL